MLASQLSSEHRRPQELTRSGIIRDKTQTASNTSGLKRKHLPFTFVLPNAALNNLLHFRDCYFIEAGWLDTLEHTSNRETRRST